MVWRLVSRRRYLLHNEPPEPPAMPCRWFFMLAATLRSLGGEGPDWIPDRFRHHPHVNYFSFFPVVFTSSKRFALQNVALASLPRASGSFGLNFASPPVVHLPFRNKSASAKGKVAVSGGGVRPLAARKRRIGALNLRSGVGFLPFRSALRLARDTEARAGCVSVDHHRLAGR